MSGNVMLSPGVKVTEVDQSQYTPISNPPSNAFGLVGTGKFGPIDTPTLITSLTQFEQTFGVSDDQSSLVAVETLRAGGQFYYVRSADTATAKAVTGTIAGGLTISGKHTGTITDGDLKAVIAEITEGKTYTITITKTVGTTETTFVKQATISLDKDSDDFYEKWENPYFTLKAATDNEVEELTAGSYALSGGNDGILSGEAMAKTVAESVKMFEDPEAVQIILLAAPYYSQYADVATAIKTVVDSRKDTLGQIDHGIEAKLADIKTLGQTYASTYIAIWAGCPVIIDPYTGLEEVCVPSAAILPGLARMYNRFDVWNAPAGASRLQLSNVIRLDKEWKLSDRDSLYESNVNPINNYKGLGYTAMGQKTTQATPSATDRINVRMLCNHIKTNSEYLSVGFLFAPIDEQTFADWTYKIGNFLEGIRQGRGLYDYKVKMDWETVTQDDLNNNRMPGIVYIKPTKVAEFISIDLVVKNYSDTF